MTLFKQIGAVTVMNLRSLPQRIGTSLVIVIGIAGVVAVLISVLAMSTGMIETLEHAGRNDRAIVMRNGTAAETGSSLGRDAARLIVDAPGLERDRDGKPIVSVEALRVVSLYKKDDGSEVNVSFRGVGEKVGVLRPEMKIIEGRMFEPAVREIIVGRQAHKQFKGLDVGSQLQLQGATWTVVGVFSTGGDAHESSLWTSAETLVSTGRRGDFQSMTVLLDSLDSFTRFKEAVTSNPALAVDVSREREYYQQQSQTMSKVISIIAYVVGGIMAVGAVFSALNTMYSAVSTRLREIATLRAIGFGATAMVMSVLTEALVLALIGGAIGAAIAWAFFNGHTVSTSAGGPFGHLVFDLSVSPALVVLGIVWACVIGLIGGLFPAVRAARMPVASALRAV